MCDVSDVIRNIRSCEASVVKSEGRRVNPRAHLDVRVGFFVVAQAFEVLEPHHLRLHGVSARNVSERWRRRLERRDERR